MNHRCWLLATAFVFPLPGLSQQLLGCAEVGCPMNGVIAQCSLDGMTATGIGISTIRSSLSSDPLTWTVATGQTFSAEIEDGDLPTWRKDYYFGQPPALQLQKSDSVRGCAIFFQGISSVLRFAQGEDDGTCADAMTAACVSDLTDQANSVIHQNGSDLNCDFVGRTLQESPPSSCLANHGEWGIVMAHSIAGPGSVEPVSMNGCNPTISNDYILSLVENFNFSASTTARNDLLSDFVDGVTPVMTVFVSTLAAKAGTDQELTQATPEVHLNCLQVQRGSDGAGTTSEVLSAAGLVVFSSSVFFIISAIELLAVLFWL